MIRHICMFKLSGDKEAAVKEFIEKAQSLREIPQIRGFNVVYNDPETPDSNFDVSLILDLDSVEDLNAYQTSPTHVEFGRYVASVKTDRACIDYRF